MNTNSFDIPWQRKAKRVMLSYGGLLLSNLAILVAMLYFSYSSHPASDSDVVSCSLANLTDSRAVQACRNSLPGLKDSQKVSVDMRICTITLVGTFSIVWLVLDYTENLNIVWGARGLHGFLACVCTSTAMLFFAGLVIRSCYCFGGLHSKYAFCAESDVAAYRHLNNVMISLILMAGSDIILGYIAEALVSSDARLLWSERWQRFVSGETSGRILTHSKNLFAPPPYYAYDCGPPANSGFEDFSNISTDPLHSQEPREAQEVV